MSWASSRSGLVALGWATALFGFGLILPLDATADVRATSGRKGLGTLVNGKRGGRCRSGVCRIGGGSKSGKNRFHRFSTFNTRGKIRSIKFDYDGSKNVVAVTSLREV